MTAKQRGFYFLSLMRHNLVAHPPLVLSISKFRICRLLQITNTAPGTPVRLSLFGVPPHLRPCSRRPISSGMGQTLSRGPAFPATAEPVATDKISAFRLASADEQAASVLGSPKGNFWLWNDRDGFDLTHPPSPSSDRVQPRLKLQCSLTPITLDPAKTALFIIDMQNYNMSSDLGNSVQAYKDAESALLENAIPAARKAAIQVIWLTWGLTEEDLSNMDPGVLRTFGWHSVPRADPPPNPRPGQKGRNDGERRNEKGLGDDLGVVLSKGEKIEGGRVLMRNTWNAQLHGSLANAYEKGQKASPPDVRFHKNRNSGMCDTMKECTEFLIHNGIKTLLFTGINTDQCVMGTLQDANLKGFDCVLLKDGCGTNSPEFAQLSAEYNCLRSWGFLSTCKDLRDAVENMSDIAKPY